MAIAELSGIEADLIAKRFSDAVDDEGVRKLHRYLTHPFYCFRPRPDSLDGDDQQESFVNSRDGVSICAGGNASGKTLAAAHHVAKYLLHRQLPPRVDTPFWVISDTYEQVCGVCWQEKLSTIIPKEFIDWSRISWYRPNRNWPYSVPLLPRKDHRSVNWVIEFKSYEQGRERMQARSIGGFWFSEQFPWEIFIEVMRGCRDCWYPGGQICEFTPVDPAKSVELASIYRDWKKGKAPRGWNFYRLNTDKNKAVSHEWRETFFAAVSDEMQDVRRFGDFGKYEGAIYQTFDERIHLGRNVEWQNCHKFRRAIDWGASADHPFVCIWLAQDGMGQWRVFDEYRSTAQVSAIHHAVEILNRHHWPSGTDPRFGATWADPSRPDNIQLFSEYGIDVLAANNGVYLGIESVRTALKVNPGTGEPGLIIDEDKCPHLAKEMATYRWLKRSGQGINPAAPRPEPLKFADDSVDALRYCLHSERTLTGGEPDSIKLGLHKRESMGRIEKIIDGRATGLYPVRVDDGRSDRKRLQ
jgi:phage terminase large subunit-like protein